MAEADQDGPPGERLDSGRAERVLLRLYLDASAVVKAFVQEPGTPEVIAAIGPATALISARHAFVEIGSAIVRALGDEDPACDVFRALWGRFNVIEITQPLCECALDLASAHGLRTLDALHLAAALSTGGSQLILATWDRRLWDATRGEGLTVLPEARP